MGTAELSREQRKAEAWELRAVASEHSGGLPWKEILGALIVPLMTIRVGLQDPPTGWNDVETWGVVALLVVGTAIALHLMFWTWHRFVTAPTEHAAYLRAELHKAHAALQEIADSFTMPADYHGASTLFWNALKDAHGRWLGGQEGQESGLDDLQTLVEESDWPIRPEDGTLGLKEPNSLLRFCGRVVPDQDSRAGILAQQYSLESRFEVEALGPLKRGLVHAAKHLDKTPELNQAVLGRLGVVQYRTLKLVLYFHLALREATNPTRPPGPDMDRLLRLAAQLRDYAGIATPSIPHTEAPDRREAEPERPGT